MISAPGIYELSAEDYHRDPCPSPSLSSSIARTLLASSPLHAWFEHPRLNPGHVREDEEKFDLGTAAHAYLLQGESGFAVIDAPDWRTKDARAARDAARAEGKLPILAHRWQDVLGMAEAAERQLAAYEETPRPFANGKAEETLVWQEGDVWCRARLDWLHADHRTIDDLKTTSASANPAVWSRALFGAGADIQAAFYSRGVRALFGQPATFRFIVQENFAPYALSVIGLGPDALVLAEKKALSAIEQWRYCMAENRWPGYPMRTCWAELPSWEEARWLQREMAEAGITDDGRPIGDLLAGGGRP